MLNLLKNKSKPRSDAYLDVEELAKQKKEEEAAAKIAARKAAKITTRLTTFKKKIPENKDNDTTAIIVPDNDFDALEHLPSLKNASNKKGGAKKEYVLYNKKRYIVKKEGRNKYIMSKGDMVFLGDIRGKYKTCNY